MHRANSINIVLSLKVETKLNVSISTREKPVQWTSLGLFLNASIQLHASNTYASPSCLSRLDVEVERF